MDRFVINYLDRITKRVVKNKICDTKDTKDWNLPLSLILGSKALYSLE